MKLAPVALFVYNRIPHVKATLEALQANKLAKETDLIIYSDGPRNPKDHSSVSKIREDLRTVERFNSIKVVQRATNMGLSGSVVSGVTETLKKYGKVIVLEDDMVTSRSFLTYMNEALECYENEDQVISVAGYCYPVKRTLPQTFFLKSTGCWGWATWQRGWSVFETDGQKLLNELEKRQLFGQFNFNNTYDFVRMLRDQIIGKNDSWAVRWYASTFLKGYLTLYPGISLVHNIGHDLSGQHCRKENCYDVHISEQTIAVNRIPVMENIEARRAFEDFYSSLRNGLTTRIVDFFHRWRGRSTL
jgi:hypothetical protein